MLIKLKYQVEICGGSYSLLTGRLGRTHQLFVVMLVWFIIIDIQHFEILRNVLSNYYGYLNSGKRMSVTTIFIKFHPVVNWIFNITNSVSVTKNFETSSLPWMIKPLKLFIPVVLHKVNHVLINIWESGFCPLKSFHINKSIQIINAETQVNSVTRCHLYFILGDTRHAVGYMDPSTSRLISWFDNIKSICVVINNFFTLSVVFLSSLRSKYDRISSGISTTGNEVCISLRILHFVSIHIFKFKRFASVLHQLETISSQLYFQNSIDP